MKKAFLQETEKKKFAQHWFGEVAVWSFWYFQ